MFNVNRGPLNALIMKHDCIGLETAKIMDDIGMQRQRNYTTATVILVADDDCNVYRVPPLDKPSVYLRTTDQVVLFNPATSSLLHNKVFNMTFVVLNDFEYPRVRCPNIFKTLDGSNYVGATDADHKQV